MICCLIYKQFINLYFINDKAQANVINICLEEKLRQTYQAVTA